MNWSALDWGILGPAFIAGLLVLATHVPLGTQVLDRGIVFIDLAIAQIALFWFVFDDFWSRLAIATSTVLIFESFFLKYFFPHYFQQLLPPLAVGAAFGAQSLSGLRPWRSSWIRPALCSLLLGILPLKTLWPFWFSYTPADAVRRIYPGNFFAEMPEFAAHRGIGRNHVGIGAMLDHDLSRDGQVLLRYP